jgi:hypothetical protein
MHCVDSHASCVNGVSRRGQVNPVILRKGETEVALYGLGNMRDERLNRMWTQKKVGQADYGRMSLLWHLNDLDLYTSVVPE